jgi:hypothetical protein
MHNQSQSITGTPNRLSTQAQAAEVPLLLDADGVRKYLAPIGRSLLYQLASRGEIETASLGVKRGKRVFVTATVVQWLERRLAGTVRPKVADRHAAAAAARAEVTLPATEAAVAGGGEGNKVGGGR